ncbi:hypothetical protein BTM25_40000 [Actinomadura rubteroloni]|uniref:Uncharacterized protein n=1 Tax=Actinomadura rubteroloni TaxID=1926885 RepID=A0A2P4UK09_9ACTN|nr:hypothetical protein [Actinomadura rubteroloni]POM25356.1 hypothetical protein BTM25_40000 [Actinomadura rubteroloni]
MSGSDDGRKPARPDGPAKEPADGAGPSAPPSFGAAAPADPDRSAPAFKLDKPWWASDDATVDDPEPSGFLAPATEPPSDSEDTEPLPAQEPAGPPRPTEATGPLRLPDVSEPPAQPTPESAGLLSTREPAEPDTGERPAGVTGPQVGQPERDAGEPSRPAEGTAPFPQDQAAGEGSEPPRPAERTGPFAQDEVAGEGSRAEGTGSFPQNQATGEGSEAPRWTGVTGPFAQNQAAGESSEPSRPAEGTSPLPQGQAAREGGEAPRSAEGTGPLSAHRSVRETGERPFNRAPRPGEGTGPLRAAEGPTPPGGTLAAAAAKPVVPPPGVDVPVGHGGLPIPGLPPDDVPPVHPAGPMADGPKGTRRRAALIGAGAVAAVLVVGAAGYALAGGDDAKKPMAAPTRPAPAASRTHHGQPPLNPTAPAAPSRIDNERTDPGPLALTAVFPTAAVTLGGRGYVRDRSSVNHDCALTARGAMATALVREKCRTVVRVTFVDRAKTLAITAGVAVLPSKAAALRTGRAGDPSRYEWFRGMQGKRSGQIDRAGGYAAATIRGRYVIYAYAQYLKGRPASGGPNLKTVARQFIDYAVRPVVARA